MTDSESRESHQPTLARFGDAVKLDRAACHHKRTKTSGGKNFKSAHEFCFCWWYKQASFRKLPQWKQGGACKVLSVESLLGMMEVFSTFSFSMTQILLPGTFRVWDPG